MFLYQFRTTFYLFIIYYHISLIIIFYITYYFNKIYYLLSQLIHHHLHNLLCYAYKCMLSASEWIFLDLRRYTNVLLILSYLT